MGRKKKDDEKNIINAYIEKDDNPFTNDDKKGLDEKFDVEPIDPSIYEPEKINVERDENDYNDFSIIFSMENKIYKNVYSDYQEMRIRMKRSLHNLETIMNKLKEHILVVQEPNPKLYDVYSKLSDSFESLTINIDKQNKQMIKTQINNFKEKIILMFKYMNNRMNTEEKNGSEEKNGTKTTMKDIMNNLEKIEENVEKSNKKRGLF